LQKQDELPAIVGAGRELPLVRPGQAIDPEALALESIGRDSNMSPFTVQEAFGGTAVTFGPNYPGVEIAFQPGGKRPREHEHGQSYVLTSPLANDQEIDYAVDLLKNDLEATRDIAKRMLKDYQTRAGKV
jgi:hypothetical protein